MKGNGNCARAKGRYLLVKGGSKAASPVVSVARTAGRSYRVWRLTRKLDGVCTAGISIVSCGDLLDELTPTQRQELGRLLTELDDDGVRLANTLGPREADRLLAHHIDDYAVVGEGLIVPGSRHGIDVEARYVDDGNAFVARLDGGDELSNGAIGEEAAYDFAKQRNYEVPDWFEKDSEYQNGIDLIAKDTETGEWVFVESKFSSSRGSVGIGDLADTKTKGRQMSDRWLLESIDELEEQGKISTSKADELRDAIEIEGNYRKELTVIKNTEMSGFTVTDSLNRVGIGRVHVIKTGEVL